MNKSFLYFYKGSLKIYFQKTYFTENNLRILKENIFIKKIFIYIYLFLPDRNSKNIFSS